MNNGFISAPRFCRQANLNMGRDLFIQDSEFYTFLKRENSEVNYISTFYQQLFSKHGRLLDIGCCRVPIKEINLSNSGICTECFKCGWEHKIKDLRIAEYCPLHFCQYLRACPNCHRAFSSLTQLSLECTCGAYLSCEVGTAASAELELFLLSTLENNDQVKVDTFFYALTKLNCHQTTYNQNLNRILSLCAMDIARGNIIKAYKRLIDSVFYGSAPTHNIIIAQLANASCLAIPQRLITQLEELKLKNIGTIQGVTFSTPELYKCLGLTRTYWYSHTLSPFKKSTRERYTIDELCQIMKLYEDKKNKNQKSLINGVCQSQARETLDIPNPIFTKLYQVGHLKKLDSTLPVVIIEIESFETFKDLYISLEAASKILDISIIQTQKIIKEHDAKCLHLPGIDAPCFIERTIFYKIQTDLALPIFRAAEFPKESTRNNSLVVQIPQASRNSQLITLKEASKLTSISINKFYILINHGVLKTYKIRTKRMVDYKSVLFFERNYTTLDNLKKATGLDARSLISVLTAHKIESAILGDNHNRIHIYKSSDISSIKIFETYDFSMDFLNHRLNRKAVTHKQAAKELNLSKNGLSILSRKILQNRPTIYQSDYYKKLFTSTELDQIKDIIDNLVMLDHLATELGISKQRIKSLFGLVKSKSIINVNNIACINSPLSSAIASYMSDYISIYKAAPIIGTSTTNLYDILKSHPDSSPYLQAIPPIKCISASHLSLLYKLLNKLPEDFSGPIKNK
ncbi:helix-turn-helix domain-containing protein [Pseudomonas wadenswilerensis]|uniref:helix-turn-helix domain-containing protein n=1 Tax=Pseudomonas wadenswilerensis TaxID=1785161 RepID=UPI0011E5F9E4|nr:helix-turn-helix domain-containing protein [Pseudomonas wadenswilerensis]